MASSLPVSSTTSCAQLAQAQHAERVADLAQHAHLRFEFGRLASAADENIEYVFDLAQVLANGRRDRAHQFHGRRGEILALLFDRVVDVQQFVETERGAHRGHFRTIAGGARGVVEKIVQQLNGRVLRITPLALGVELQDFAIGQTHEPLDGHAGFQSTVAQRLDNGADHPPELEHGLLGRDLFQLVRNGFEDLEVLLDAFTADPAHETELKSCPQSPRPLRHRECGFAGRGRYR